jgi:hypothetical protein
MMSLSGIIGEIVRLLTKALHKTPYARIKFIRVLVRKSNSGVEE